MALQHWIDLQRIGKVFFTYTGIYCKHKQCGVRCAPSWENTAPQCVLSAWTAHHPFKQEGRREGSNNTAQSFITAGIYISSSRWLLFKQTQRCCLKVKESPRVRRSNRRLNRQDDRGRTCKDGICRSSRYHLLRSCHSVVPLCAQQKTITWFYLWWCFHIQSGFEQIQHAYHQHCS